MLPILGTLALAAAPPDIDTPLRTGASADADSAVVIGVEDYAFLPDVPHAARDAQAFYNAMVYTRGIPPERVQMLRGANREQIQRAVAEAVQEGAGGRVWVYFSGHGGTSPDGDPLLVGDDAKPDPTVFSERAVRIGELGLPPSAMLVVDASFGGTDWEGEPLVPGARFAVPSYAAEGPVLWSASGHEPAAYYPAADHGLFTWLVVGALRGWADGELGEPDGTVDLDEVREYVARAAGVLDAEVRPDVGSGQAQLVAGNLERAPALEQLVDVEGHTPAPVPVPVPRVVETTGVAGGSAEAVLAVPGPEDEVPSPPLSHMGGRQFLDDDGRVWSVLEVERATGDAERMQKLRGNSGTAPYLLYATGAVASVFALAMVPVAITLKSSSEPEKAQPPLVAGITLAGVGAGLFALGPVAQRAHMKRMAETYSKELP